MKSLLAGLTPSLLSVFAVMAVIRPRPQSVSPAAGPTRTPVVVELFTSEGCSNCPPADELLSRLRQEQLPQGAEVILLGFHVDYWNSLGWQDRFSSADYSKRQEQYAQKLRTQGPYTPQMVVDGAVEFVGNNGTRAHQAIAEAALRTQPAQVEVSFAAQEKVLVHVSAPKLPPGNDVLLAITEDNLGNKIGAGENNGRMLRHSAVVRELRRLGQVHDGVFDA